MPRWRPNSNSVRAWASAIRRRCALFGVDAFQLLLGEAPRDVVDALVPGCGRCRPALENGDPRHAVGAASIAALRKRSGIGPQSRA